MFARQQPTHIKPLLLVQDGSSRPTTAGIPALSVSRQHHQGLNSGHHPLFSHLHNSQTKIQPLRQPATPCAFYNLNHGTHLVPDWLVHLAIVVILMLSVPF